MHFTCRMTLAMAAWLFLASLAIAPACAQEDLAKKSQNPIGNLISVPFENNTSFGSGSENAVVNNFKLNPWISSFWECGEAGGGCGLGTPAAGQVPVSEISGGGGVYARPL